MTAELLPARGRDGLTENLPRPFIWNVTAYIEALHLECDRLHVDSAGVSFVHLQNQIYPVN